MCLHSIHPCVFYCPLTGSWREGAYPSWLQARGGDKKQGQTIHHSHTFTLTFTLTFAPKVDLEPPVHLTPQMHGFGLWKLEDPERTLVDRGGTCRVHRDKPLGSLTPETCGCVRTVLTSATQCLLTPKNISFLAKRSFTLQQKIGRYQKGTSASACGAVSQMNPRGFVALSCCDLLGVDELGGLASSPPVLQLQAAPA